MANRGKNQKNTKYQKRKHAIEQLSEKKVDWVGQLAGRVRKDVDVLARFLAEVFAILATSPLQNHTLMGGRWDIAKSLARMFLPTGEKMLDQVEKTWNTLEMSLGEASQDLLRDPELTAEVLIPVLETFAQAVEANPRLAFLVGQPELVKEALGEWGERVVSLFSFLPALSSRAAEKFPELREHFFVALFNLSTSDRKRLHALAEDCLRVVHSSFVFPRVEELLQGDERGCLLSPILTGVVEAIPGESCINAIIGIACTPQKELTTGRVIALAIQELGGLYLKVCQVLAELCPPSLARELRTSQDEAGGLYPSIEKSWNCFLQRISQPDMAHICEQLVIPEKPQRHFAAASVGALYQMKLNERGRSALGTELVLIKLQRPGLMELFEKQTQHILVLCAKAESLVTASKIIAESTRHELMGTLQALRRTVLNYRKQSVSELDFRQEEINANRVSQSLGDVIGIRVPKYYFVLEDVAVMERMPGTKVTKIVQTKYLERREIADQLANAYIRLVFEQGVVWADPHPGNILYDDVTAQMAMIDLNPCFVWDTKVREYFKQLIYRLVLRDAGGVHTLLYYIIDEENSSPDGLNANRLLDDLQKVLGNPLASGSLMRFVGEFLKVLAENKLDLRVEVQAALRGLSQIAVTTNSISARNSFGKIIRQHFGLKQIFKAALDIGVFQAARVLTATVFDIARQQPEEDVGPVLDERDIGGIVQRTTEMRRAGVCHVKIHRVSPEDSQNLRMSADGSVLLVTSDLHLEILEKRRPATVKYCIQIPTRVWLKERQEFVKLSSIARNFCIIESLEQLRRNSLDDYWRIVESWNKPAAHRTVEETRLIGEVKTAARRLYALRFAQLWESNLGGLPNAAKRLWSWLLEIESWREETEQKYLTSVKRKYRDEPLTNLTLSTFYRLKMILMETALWTLRRRIRRYRFNMNLVPMTARQLEDLVLFSLSRNFSGRN